MALAREVSWHTFPERVGQRGILLLLKAKTPIRGFSARHGEPLTLALSHGYGWAKVMLAQIQCRVEAPSAP